MPSHRIHLKGPWDYDWRPMGDPSRVESRKGTVTMPQSWQTLFGDQSGSAQFRRKFHRPTNLDPHERVMIVFTELRGQGQVQLNQSPIGEFDARGELVEFDITDQMKSFNELTVEISFDPQIAPGNSGGLSGPAALEIRSE